MEAASPVWTPTDPEHRDLWGRVQVAESQLDGGQPADVLTRRTPYGDEHLPLCELSLVAVRCTGYSPARFGLPGVSGAYALCQPGIWQIRSGTFVPSRQVPLLDTNAALIRLQ